MSYGERGDGYHHQFSCHFLGQISKIFEKKKIPSVSHIRRDPEMAEFGECENVLYARFCGGFHECEEIAMKVSFRQHNGINSSELDGRLSQTSRRS